MKYNIDLVSEIINDIPSEYNMLEKARFIYIKLGEILEFNCTFRSTNFTHQYLIKHKKYNLRNIENNQIMCHNWANIYASLLKMVGIKAKKKGTTHAWVVFYVDNLTIYTDATISSYNDLTRIKYHDNIQYFYPVDEYDKMIDVDGFSNYMDEIDKKIGYFKTDNIAIKLIKPAVEMLPNIEKKVELLISYTARSNIGLNEQILYFLHLIRETLEVDESKKISTTEIIKDTNCGMFEFIWCVSVEIENSYKYYLFKDNDYFEVTEQELLRYANENYGAYNCSMIKGFDYPIKFTVPRESLERFYNNYFSINNPFEKRKNNIR